MTKNLAVLSAVGLNDGSLFFQPGRIAQSVGTWGPGFDTQSGHILSFLLPSKSMCTKYWLTA